MVYHDDLVKLALSAVMGILLGLEREMKRKPLGLRTCLVISVTSCLLTIVSVDTAVLSNQMAGVVRSDPMRLAAQIVSGIGFLGAGVIMRRNNEVISGLTTAAMVWASAGLGIAIGAGFFIDAVVGLFLLIISVELIPFILRRTGPRVLREKEVELTLVVSSDVDLREIAEKIAVLESRVERIRTRELGDHTREVTLVCVVDRLAQLTDLFHAVEGMPGVLSVDALSL
ncbi:MAG: MgtC/SapB family protein [Alicyclobacillaceae bacterium]|nr:MgtC/SapB family protein [Alicyclobacillaceae bacterium]